MDAKGRVSLPAKHRRILPEDLVIVPSPEKGFPSLWIYSDEAYDAWAESVMESKGGPQANSKSQYYLRRQLYGKKEEISCDTAGRILVPQELRKYASLEKSVVIIGAGNHVEIWNPDILEQSDAFYREEQHIEILDLP
jgi:MraZ protein